MLGVFFILRQSGGWWGIGDLWSSMAWLGQADIILLALMLVNTVVIVCHRLWLYGIGRKQSRAFVSDAAAALRDGRFDEVMTIAGRNSQSHLASVVAAGLTAFVSAPKQYTDMEAINAAERAFRRHHNMLSAHLRVGLGSLATIASSAPLIGLVGAVFGIMHAFRGVSMEKSTWMAMVASSMAEALATTAMGLLVGIPAVWCRNYLCDRIEVFESEMSNAALEAVTYLNAHSQWRDQPQLSGVEATGFVFDPSQNPGARSWEVPYDRQRLLLLAIWSSFLYFALMLASAMYWHWVYALQARYNQNPSKWQQIGGQEIVSPDLRYRAVVPLFCREKVYSSGKDGYPHWSCASSPEVALRIVPNDRPRTWVPYPCGTETKYALEPNEALLTWNCSVPVVTWRTNDELLIQCSDCSSDSLQLVKPGFFPDRITALGADGKRIHPQVVHPQPQCFD